MQFDSKKFAEDDRRDIKIKTGRTQRDALTVLELLDEMKKNHEPHARERFPSAMLNEKYFHGKQFVDIVDEKVDNAIWGDDNALPRVSLNYVSNNVLSYAARILEDRPTVKGWPSDPSRYDAAATEMANSLIQYLHQKIDLDAMMMRAAVLAQCHGSIAIKPTWDPDAGPFLKVPHIDEETGLPQVDPQTDEPVMVESEERAGDLRWDLVTIFGYLTDPVEDERDSMGCGFRRCGGYHEAKDMLLEAGIKEDPALEKFDTTSGIQLEGVEIWEIWYRPGPRVPKGLYAVIAGGHVVSAEDFPYLHGEIPLCVWKIRPQSDSPHATSHLDDAVSLQRGINESISLARQMRRQIGENVKLLAPDYVANEWQNANQIIKVNDGEHMRSIKWLGPPHESMQALVADVDKDREFLFDVFGLNEMLTGAEAMKSGTAGKAVAYVKQLDSQKLAMAARNMGECLKRAWSQTLKLAQQYVAQERMIEIGGMGSQFSAIAFKGSDIEGVDVILEPTAGTERWRASAAPGVDEDVQRGYTPLEAGSELRETGLNATGDEAAARFQAQKLIENVVQGAPPQFDGSVPAPVMIEEIQTALEIHPEAQQALQMLDSSVRKFQQQQQMQMQQQQPQPQPQRAPPKGSPPAQVSRQQPPLPKGGSFQ